jgi:hypothetical protein
MEIHRDRDTHTIMLTQMQYIIKILHTAGMENCNPVATPMDPNVKLEKLLDGISFSEIKETCQSLVGGLMYAALCTRPNITYAVQSLLQYRTRTYNCCKKSLSLPGSITLGINYSGNESSKVFLYLDADWGSNINNQKSISEYISTLSGGAITWSSKKQPTVALSSMEVEYMALANATQENKWI